MTYYTHGLKRITDTNLCSNRKISHQNQCLFVAFFKKAKQQQNLGMMEHICNPRIWDAGAEGFQVQCQTVIHSETLSQLINCARLFYEKMYF